MRHRRLHRHHLWAVLQVSKWSGLHRFKNDKPDPRLAEDGSYFNVFGEEVLKFGERKLEMVHKAL